MVPITFRFHHSFDLMSSSINYIFLKTSRQICRVHCQQFDFFQVVCRNAGWEIPSSPLDELCYHRQHSCLPQHKLVHILCCILISLLSNLCYVLTWSITIFDVKNVVRIAPPLKNSCYSVTSHNHHSFLVLALIPTGVPTSERCCLDSAYLATLLLWS